MKSTVMGPEPPHPAVPDRRGAVAVTARRRSWLLHPAAINTGMWVLVGLLYSFRLAAMQIVPAERVWQAVFWISVAFAAGSGAAGAWHALARPHPPRRWSAGRVRRRVWVLLGAAGVGLAVEVAQFGGVPLLWLLLGRQRLSYATFGYASLNGFLISIVLASGLVGFYLFLRTSGRRKWMYACLALAPFAWGIVVVSRALLVYEGIECLLLWLVLRRPSAKRLARLAVIAVLGMMLFGAIGNYRTGNSNLIRLAGFTPWAVDHVPASFLWVYAYTATPVENLAFTIALRRPAMDWTMPSTLSVLFPTVIRKILYPNVTLAERGLLFNPAFNVSTAYVGPYQDLGWLGIVGFAAFWGGLAAWGWGREDPVAQMCYCVITGAVILSMFYDLYLYLPYIFQLLWIGVVFAGSPTHSAARRLGHGVAA